MGQSGDEMILKLEAMLAKGGDAAPLRLALASRYLSAGDAAMAVQHAEAALRLDAEYSAAWKLLGRALTETGRASDAEHAFRDGIANAEKRGDKQAVKEMRVFLRRLERARAEKDGSEKD